RLIPIVDVVTGASAGGLNGVFLALGITFGHRDLTSLRTLWLEEGSFEKLLRDPTDAHLPSLMKGDEYFLPQLQRAAAAMMQGKHPRRYDGDGKAAIGRTLPPPVYVRLTTTSLPGTTTKIPDQLSTLYDTDHHAAFTFEESFLGSQDDDVAPKLARACRSTA